MGAFDSVPCLKKGFLTWVKCVSNMSARYFSSVVFMFCLCFNHLVSTLIPAEKGETAASTAEICTVYITALHPTVRSQHRVPGAELGSNHQHVRGDQTQPSHSQGPHFFLSWQLAQISEHKHEESNPEQTICGRCHQGSWKRHHSAPPRLGHHCFHNIPGARHSKLCERSNSVQRTLKPTLTPVREN